MDANFGANGFETPVTRYYVDVRPYVSVAANRNQNALQDIEELPLINALPKETQDKICRYRKPTDRFMSLASALLKHLFIHRATKIPWAQVEVMRTPKPHLRPYWQPSPEWQNDGFGGVEFNVSHQAGMVVLVGCYVPKRSNSGYSTGSNIPSPTIINPDPTAVREIDSEIDEHDHEEVRVGVDIACTNESSQTANARSQSDVNEWVDIFGEMFSKQETFSMKFATVPDHAEDEATEKIRRFFTYWSLKEAYIKMVGEGLMADWLRDLEFDNVTAPQRPASSTVSQWSKSEVTEGMTAPAGLKITFKGKNITGTMRTDLESFEGNFIIATMFRGVTEKTGQQEIWKLIHFENDIRPCAEGTCSCLL